MPATPRAMCSTRRGPTPRALARRAFGLMLTATAVAACSRRSVPDTGLNTDVALAGQLQRQRVPSLVAPPEPGRASRQDFFRAVVGSSSRARGNAPIVPTRIVTRTAAVAPSPPPHTADVPDAGAGHRGSAASAGEVVAAAPPGRRTTDGGVASSAAPPTSTTPASTTETGAYGSGPATSVGTYGAGTEGSGTYGAGTYGAGPSTQRPTDGADGASAPVYRQAQSHAARDGAFGSVAGAILGAAVGGHNRVRGGLIGAVAGGALGAVYGGSVDRTVPIYGSSGRAKSQSVW